MTVENLNHDRRTAADPPSHYRPSGKRPENSSPDESTDVRPRTVRIHQERFLRILGPESVEEMQLVERLAIAQSNLDEAQAAWDERVRWQMDHAAELHDRGQLERFRADSKAWRSDPHAMRMLFGRTWHSASFLRDLWFAAGMALKSDLGLSISLVKDLILSQCGDWRVDRIDPWRGRIMSWILALQPDAANFTKRWVAESRAGRDDVADVESDMTRAKAILATAPAPVYAKRNLLELAEKETKSWSEQADQLLEASLLERNRYAEIPSPHALGGADDVRETRRIRRVLTLAESRFEKLERRLWSILQMRRKAKPARCGTTPSACEPESPMSPESFEAGPTELPGKRIQWDVHDSLRACALETAPRAAEIRNATPGAEATETDLEPAGRNRAVRRPDPKSVAKRWRTKHGQERSRPKNGSCRSTP